jgi:pyridoxine 5-phosphate synthase
VRPATAIAKAANARAPSDWDEDRDDRQADDAPECQLHVAGVWRTPADGATVSGMARLSVNLNKVALLRNSRRTGVPDVLHLARIALDAGAAGLTVHPRPDERHIRRSDVPALAALMQPLRPRIEFNIEGYPDERMTSILAEAKPEQCTLVPDAPEAFTSEEGWQLNAEQMAFARPAVAAAKALHARVILFIDPNPDVVPRVRDAGANGVEIYTGGYAAAFRTGTHAALLAAIGETARRAQTLGLVVNAGHDLNLRNIPPLMHVVPFLAEASIGHELTADALEMGFSAAVRAYAAALHSG